MSVFDKNRDLYSDAKDLLTLGYISCTIKLGYGKRVVLRSLTPSEINNFSSFFNENEKEYRKGFAQYATYKSLIGFSSNNYFIDYRKEDRNEFKIQEAVCEWPDYLLEYIVFIQNQFLMRITNVLKWINKDENQELLEKDLYFYYNALKIDKDLDGDKISKDLGKSPYQQFFLGFLNLKDRKDQFEMIWQGVKFLAAMINPKAIQKIDQREQAQKRLKKLGKKEATDKDIKEWKEKYGDVETEMMLAELNHQESDIREYEVQELIGQGLTREEAQKTDYHEYIMDKWEERQREKVDKYKKEVTTKDIGNIEERITSSMRVISAEELQEIREKQRIKEDEYKLEAEKEHENYESRIFKSLTNVDEKQLDNHDRIMKKWEDDNFKKFYGKKKESESKVNNPEEFFAGGGQRVISPEEFLKIRKIEDEKEKEPDIPKDLNIHNVDRYIRGE